MFCYRLLSICVLIPIIIYMIFFSSFFQFTLLLYCICLISVWEWGKLMRFSRNIYCIWMYMMFNFLYIIMINLNQNYLYINFWCIFFIFVIVGWMLIFLLVLFYPDSADFWKKSDILRFLLGIFMIIPFFCSVLVLYQFNYINSNIYGQWWLLYILTLVWINDSSAYIIGRILGKHKLLKHVSPKKTWEGCIGGFLFCIGMCWLFNEYIVTNIIKNSGIIFICCINSVVFAIMGDLTESMFKRESGVKDTSNLIPGHGGLLDRIDSLLSAIPIFVAALLLLTHIHII